MISGSSICNASSTRASLASPIQIGEETERENDDRG